MSTSSDPNPMPRFVPPPLPRRDPEPSSDDEVDNVFKPLPSLECPVIAEAPTAEDTRGTVSSIMPTVSPEPSVTVTSIPSSGRQVTQRFPKNLIGVTLLDRYRVVEMLGEGAMGVVLMGEHVTIGRRVAIKILKLHAARAPEKAKERFLREARMISMINHDNVVQISDFGETADGLPFFVMEYLEGEDLSLLLRREGRQSWSRVKFIAVQICRALRAAHSVGVIHRDMKLENCFMVARPDVEDFIKVLDFGIAKIIEGDAEQKQGENRLSTLTRTGEVVGTAAYMAPEQAKGEHLDARTDLYSVGIMLYELLVGCRPFDADSVIGLMHKQAFEAPRRPSEVAPHAGILSSMDAVILKALEKDPDDRYQSAGEMLEAIEVVAARMPTHPNLAGETLQSRYKLIERIGVGGMGTVYLARHTTIGRRLAVKILHNEYVRLYKGRFLQEAKAASQINHDNVVQITDYGETNAGQPFLVMEYLEGECLSDTLKREGQLPWSRVKHISIQLCRGLQAAHAAGIVHRDIKPDNCFRVSKDDNDDHIKILDFGIARMTNTGAKITVTGDIIGTAAYMAPEQARGDKDVDHRVDIYAIGIMMYEMLAGVRPFDGQDDFAILHQHIYSQPVPLSHHAARVPHGAQAVVFKAIEKAPSARYSSVREMISAIAAIADVDKDLVVETVSLLTGEVHQPAVNVSAIACEIYQPVVSTPSASSPMFVPDPRFSSPTIPEVRPFPQSATGSHTGLHSRPPQFPWAFVAIAGGAFALLSTAAYFTTYHAADTSGSALSTLITSSAGRARSALQHQLEELNTQIEAQPQPEPEPPPDDSPTPGPTKRKSASVEKSRKAKVIIERVGYDCVEGMVDSKTFKIQLPSMKATLEFEPGTHSVKYGACGGSMVKVGTFSLRARETRRITATNPPVLLPK
jgi:serine/threonine protein kinase